MMKSRKFFILFFILVYALIGCKTEKNKQDGAVLIQVDDLHTGPSTMHDKYLYYASYDMGDRSLLPDKTRIKSLAIGEDKDGELIYEFDKAMNISYLKCIDDRLVIVADDLKVDKIYILDDKDLIELAEAPVGEINPSYSGGIVTWFDDKNHLIYKLDLDGQGVSKVAIKNLAVNKYERPFNFEGKTYFFTYKDSEKEAIKLVALDWETEQTEDVLVYEPGLKVENGKATNIEMNSSFIVWQKKSRKESLLYVYDRAKNKVTSYSQDDFSGFIKHTSLIGDKLYVFDEAGAYGIEVLDLKEGAIKDGSDLFNFEDDIKGFGPVFPYWTEGGFVSSVDFNQKGSSFILVEGR